MPLPDCWAQPEDFATLFQYFWHRDFPIDAISVGAKRVDWTIHIGVIVRSIGDLMGMVTRFEAGGKKDVVLRSADGDEIALEWEWGGVWGNELDKLKNHKVFSINKAATRLLKYAVLITYTHTPNIGRVYDHLDPLLAPKSLDEAASFFVKSGSLGDFGEGDFSPFLAGLWGITLSDFRPWWWFAALVKMW